MELSHLQRTVAGIPHIAPERGAELYAFVRDNRIQRPLELGTAHGVSACYIAAALHEHGRGMVTTVDRTADRREPAAETLVERCGLNAHVEVVREKLSYTWYLKRLIEQRSSGDVCEPLFDFCFFDGSHDWDTEGFAFFLVDKLLKPGGWLLFDDMNWTYGGSPTMAQRTMNMPEEWRFEAQISKVFSLLVRQHPGYRDFRTDRGWGWARKYAPTEGGVNGVGGTSLVGVTG